jgi:hypothetical protein
MYKVKSSSQLKESFTMKLLKKLKIKLEMLSSFSIILHLLLLISENFKKIDNAAKLFAVIHASV